MVRLEHDLGMSEPQRRQAGSGVRLIANTVSRLLCGRAVVAQAVGLDHQPKFRPVEVDLESVQVAAGLGERQASPPGEWQEAPL